MDREGPLEGRVRDVTHAGDAVIETAHGIVFARGALPDERVRVQPTRRVRGVWHARLLAVLEPSPARVEPPCPLVARCGGCPLMAFDDAAERRWKLARFARVLGRVGASVQPELRTGASPLAYRARTRLAFAGDGSRFLGFGTGQNRETENRPLLGFRAAGSRGIVDVERCAVLMPALARGLSVVRDELARHMQGEGEITLALGAGGRAVVEIVAELRQPQALHDAAAEACRAGRLAGVVVRAAAQPDQQGRGSGHVQIGDVHQVLPHPSGAALRSPVGAFAQANAELNVELVRCVADLAQPLGARLLELYAGSGNLTFALADAKSLTAVESDARAATALRAQLQARGLRDVKVLCADAAQGARGPGALDAVVLDPPRAGARDAIAALLPRQPGRIVYVSCDLATLERDLRTLTEAGYRIDRAVAFDMFPQTAHLESVVRLRLPDPRDTRN